MDKIERRGTQRRPAADNQATLLWDDGPEVRSCSAKLVDVSREGARFIAETSPPQGRNVCLRLETPRRSGWVSVHVARTGELAGEGGLCFSGLFSEFLIASLV